MGTFCKDPLLMQHCNTRAFELPVKLNFPMPKSLATFLGLGNLYAVCEPTTIKLLNIPALHIS